MAFKSPAADGPFEIFDSELTSRCPFTDKSIKALRHIMVCWTFRNQVRELQIQCLTPQREANELLNRLCKLECGMPRCFTFQLLDCILMSTKFMYANFFNHE
ncbi:hypothetical protein Mapa_015067 [Marchantia paleacea]|nr:hypothetical protein Mapa_015067 [Marchantia paleacea]